MRNTNRSISLLKQSDDYFIVIYSIVCLGKNITQFHIPLQRVTLELSVLWFNDSFTSGTLGFLKMLLLQKCIDKSPLEI